MLEELKRLVKHSGIYGFGVLLQRSVGFLMIPVYTHYLSPADYGVLEMLDLIIFFSGIFATLGIYAATFRFYGAYESEEDKKEVISTAFLFYAASTLVLATALMIGAGPIALAVLGSPTYAPLVRLVSVTWFFSSLASVPLAYLRVRERTLAFVAVSLAQTLLGASLLAVAIAGLKWGVKGALYANLLTSVIIGLALSGVILRRIPRKISKEKLRLMLAYGVPLVPWNLAFYALIFSDRFFLRRYGNLAEVGVYSLGYKIAGIVSVLINGPFAFAWAWQQFEVAKRKDAREVYAKIQTYQLLVSVLMGLGVAVLARDVLRIMAPENFWSAARIVPLIVLCYVLDNIRSVTTSGLLVRRDTRYLAGIAAIVIASNLLLNYVLIPRYHAMGAALATLASYALLLVLCYIVGQRVYYVRYAYGKGAFMLASATVFYLFSTLYNLPIAVSILANSLLIALFGLVSLGVLNHDERAMVFELGTNLAGKLRRVLARPGPDLPVRM